MPKPPLTPRQAAAISLGGLAAGMAVTILACTVYLMPFWEAFAYYAIWASFVLAFPWACLQQDTKDRVVRALNRFKYFAVAILIVVLVMQWGTERTPFPIWAIAALITAGLAAFSVVAYCAIVNFHKWWDGGLKDPDGR